MLIGNRSVKTIFKSIFTTRHYKAFLNMLHIYDNFLNNFYRYFFAKGIYPYSPLLNTPIGIVSPTLYSSHDLLTVNEIFCRLDYESDNEKKVIVDIGSNIGISALYFLSRNVNNMCYLFEPNPKNIERLRFNLTNYEGKYSLYENAVANFSGSIEFGIEETGRYGGIEVESETKILVNCLSINTILKELLDLHEFIDILKIDTEGSEIETIMSIDDKYFEKIKSIYVETEEDIKLNYSHFSKYRYGPILKLINKNY